MKTVTTINEGVEAVLRDMQIICNKKWEYIPAKGKDLVDTLIVDGNIIPLFWWRYDNQVFPLHDTEPKIDSVSCKLCTVSQRTNDLDRLMVRHFDIAEWLLNSKIKKLNCYQNGKSAELLLTMDNEKVAMVELAASLGDNTDEQGRMTIWGRKGMVSNRVVSQKVTPQSVYVFHSDGKEEIYNDLCITLYGLSKVEVFKVSAIVAILCDKVNFEEYKTLFERYKYYLTLTHKSAEENKPYCVKEMEK